MKYLKFFVILTIFTMAKLAIGCDNNVNEESKSQISVWLGDNSLFSQAYKDGKCVLDKALVNIPIGQRRIIANLIAKSYSIEIKKIEEISNYNY